VASRDPLTTLDRWHHNTGKISNSCERQGKKNYNNSLHFCDVVINQAKILNTFNFANITSQFTANAMFAIVDPQTAIHT
jgi:hypothetical protein